MRLILLKCRVQRIAKYFDAPTDDDDNNQELYFGKVESYREEDKLWHIEYDDGDSEDFDFGDLS